MSIYCLAEQETLPSLKLLPTGITITVRPQADLARDGWEHPLLVLGDVLSEPNARQLVQRAYRNTAPLLILPPLPVGDMTDMLGTPAPLNITRQRADTIELTDDALKQSVGRDTCHIYCTEAIETALQSGTLAAACGKPVIWAYQPTRAATPVVLVAAQLLLVSARTDPLDRDDLLAALLEWAAVHTRTSDIDKPAEPASQVKANLALLRALVVAWAANPGLTPKTLPGWLRDRLGVEAPPTELEAALEELKQANALDAQNRPQAERLAELVNAWGLRAWIREALSQETDK